MLQTLLAGALVAAAFAYSAWALMPAAWLAGLLRRLGRRVGPTTGGCGGCGGGCAAPAASAPGTAVVTLHRQRPAAAGPATAPTARPDGSAGATAH